MDVEITLMRFPRWSLATFGAAALFLAALPGAHAATASPDLEAQQWGLEQVHAPQGWASTPQGSGVVVGLIDSGVDRSHPDLAAQLVGGATFLECGSSSCGDGDWLSGPTSRRASASPHGTHTAGIIAATRDAAGVTGVAPLAKILPIKALDEAGGTEDDIARSVRYAVDNGAKVINMSLAGLPGTQVLTSVMDDAVKYALSNGVVVVASAGNEAFPLCETPAFNDGVICVAATDKREVHSFYSDFTLKPDKLAVSAPGGSALPLCREDVVSSVPVGTGSNACAEGTSWEEMAGTSMAAPHVAGVAALLLSQGRTAANVVEAITRTARNPLSGARGSFDPVYGYGIVDAAAAAAYAGATGGATPGGSTTGAGKRPPKKR